MDLLTKVLICEPQVLLRQGLVKLIDSSLFSIVGETSYTEDVLALIKENTPDIVILGQKSLQISLVNIVENIVSNYPDIRIVILSESGTYTEVLQAKDIGVHGYLLKTIDAFSFNRSLNIILTGENVFPLDLDGNSRTTDKLAGLTGRERQILWHIAHGSSNKNVASDLKIAEGTVKVHVKSILKKLNIENRTQAAIYVHEKGVAHYLAK